jgi:hypothetical protein
MWFAEVTRKLHRVFLSSIFPNHPKARRVGGRACPLGGGGIEGLHPVPELTGEVCLSIAARSELRGLGRSRLCRLQAAHDAQGPYPRDGLPLACRLYGPTLRAERPHPQAVRAADSDVAQAGL